MSGHLSERALPKGHFAELFRLASGQRVRPNGDTKRATRGAQLSIGLVRATGLCQHLMYSQFSR